MLPITEIQNTRGRSDSTKGRNKSIIAGDFITPHSITDGTSRLKHMEDMNKTITLFKLVDIHRTSAHQ